MTEFDLTPKITPYIDQHLVFPILEFFTAKEIYDETSLNRAKFDLSSRTLMIDFTLEVWQSLHPNESLPEEMLIKRQKVIDDYTKISQEIKPIMEVLEKAEVKTSLGRIPMYGDKEFGVKQAESLEFLTTQYQFAPELLDTVYKHAKTTFEAGKYETACASLVYCSLLYPEDHPNYTNALWGITVCHILRHSWEAADTYIKVLQRKIDKETFGAPLRILQQRAWLMHWGLFVFFNAKSGIEQLIRQFTENRYLNAIQTLCPHLLRYLGAALVLSRKKSDDPLLKSFLTVIGQECYRINDPIVRFFQAVYLEYNFEHAQQILRRCEQVLKNDFFLTSCTDQFIDQARRMMFETVCYIHNCISISKLAEKLNMNEQDAEEWIVDIITNSEHLNARIDSKNGQVILGMKQVSPYEEITKKAQNVCLRLQTCQFRVDRYFMAVKQRAAQMPLLMSSST